MKKKLMTTLLFSSMMMLFTGCGENVTQTTTSMEVEAGETFSLDAMNCFEGYSDKAVAEDFIFDASGIDTSVLGEQELIITYKDTEYPLVVNVVDTTAPEAVIPEDYVYITNDLESLDTAEYDMTVTDATTTTVTFDSTTLTEEGKGSVLLQVTDAGGNVTEVTIPVLYDATAPIPVDENNNEKTYSDKTVEQKDVTAQPEYETITFADELSGIAEVSDTTITETDKDKHIWTVSAAATDKAGNQTELSYTITVKEKATKTTSSTSTASSGSSGSSGSHASESFPYPLYTVYSNGDGSYYFYMNQTAERTSFSSGNGYSQEYWAANHLAIDSAKSGQDCRFYGGTYVRMGTYAEGVIDKEIYFPRWDDGDPRNDYYYATYVN